MKLTPAFSARSTMASTSACGRAPITFQKTASSLPPKVMVPSAISETKRPVRPSCLYFMGEGPLACGHGEMRGSPGYVLDLVPRPDRYRKGPANGEAGGP